MTTPDDLSSRKAQLSEARRALLRQRLQGKKVGEQPESQILPGTREGVLPLSFTQQRVWFLQQLFPDNRAYNMSEAWRLRGPLDVPALQQALQEIAARHAALRTRFVAPENEPLQEVLAEVSLTLPVNDISHLPPAVREEMVPQLVLAAGNHAFELEQAPLFRPTLIRLDSEDHVLQLVLHHIITDEWSNDVIWRELNQSYAASRGSHSTPLPESAIKYSDYAQWQRQQVAAGALEPQLRYWQEQLSGDLTLLQLPVDRPRGSGQSLQGGIIRRSLPASLMNEIKLLSNQAGSSLFVTLLAAFQALLHRLSGQDDILVGTPIANRQRPETKDVVGMFINTAVIRTPFTPDITFQQLLAQVQQTVLDALANQDLPFDLLVQAMHPDRDLSYNPLFQAMFVYRSDSVERALPGLYFEPVLVDRGVSKFDLTLFAGEQGPQLYSAIEYSADLFDTPTIERILDYWQTLLHSLAAEPQRPVSSLPLLGAAERELVLINWNKTAVPLRESRCLHEIIGAQAARQPQAAAVISDTERLTYAELDTRANKLAQQLARYHLQPGTPVGLFVERSAQMVVGILGILKAGGAYIPLAPNYPQERILFALEDTQAPVIVTQAHLRDRLPPNEADIIIVDQALDPDAVRSAAPDTAVSLDNLAYIIYTSGSTGTPKGVMVSHNNLLASTLARENTYKEPVGRFLLLSSFAFDSSVAGIFWTLASGGTLVLPAPDDEKDIPKLAAAIAREQVTHTLALPSLYRLLLAYAPPRSLDSLQVIIAAGEACPPDLAEIHYQRLPGSALYNEYGPTEATVWCSVYRLPRISDSQSVPIGRPIANSQIHILDARQQPVPIGVPGELYISGANVTPGYWNNPELTAAHFPTLTLEGLPQARRMYRTGDLARWLASGQIEFLGRVDNQVKIRGFRIEPGEIEARLVNHPLVQEAAVIAAADRSGSPYLAAYAAPVAAGTALDAGDLHSYVSELLPAYMVPAHIIILPELPRTPNGKLDRRQLPAPQMTRERAVVPPRTPAEAALARIWREVLNMGDISVEDTFFSLGGDSIMSIQVIARARQEGLVLTPRQIFEEQTIARLAAAATPTALHDSAAENKAGPLPLTPIQHWFFSQHLANPAHWNQAGWFEASSSINLDHLRAALAHVTAHHPQLRARFLAHGDGWRQEIASEPGPLPLALVDLAEMAPEAQDAAMVETANSLHARLNLTSGPIMQAALFDLGLARPPRLLLIIHHLAVDAVSWRLISASLTEAYRQEAAGKTAVLPRPPATYGQWARTLERLATTDELRRELPFWVEQLSHTLSLPTGAAGGDSNTEGSAALIAVSLEPEATKQLLREVHKAYHTRIDDLLLAALVRALARWTGQLTVPLALERHGREELDPQLDVSQTVGWFTALFPLALALDDLDDVGAAIRAIKEQLRRLPRGGTGYGILRYLGSEESRQRLAALPQPVILFNYLGQASAPMASHEPLQPLLAETGQTYGKQNERAHLLDINARVANGRLTFKWQFAPTHFAAAAIQKLAEQTIADLQQIIDHCLHVEQSRHTPSDFPLAGLQQDDLDDLADLLAGLG